MDEVEAPPRSWSKVPQETISYLTEVEKHFKSLQDPEEQQLLVANVLDELAGSELVVIADPTGSRLLETLLKGVAAEQLVRILQAVANTESFYQASTSGPGCHVLEKLLAGLLECLLAHTQQHLEQMEEVLEAIVGLVTADLYDYILDRNATYVARRLLCVVAGRDVLPVSKKGGQREAVGTQMLSKKGKRSGLAAKVHVASDMAQRALYPHLVGKFVEALQRAEFNPETLRGLAASPFSGPFLQALLTACKEHTGTLEMLIPRLLGSAGSQEGAVSNSALGSVDPDAVRSMMQETSSSHLIEAIFTNAPEAMQRELCQKCLCGHLTELSLHHTANFVVQAALASTHHPKLVQDLFSELQHQLGTLLQRRRGYVVAALTVACSQVAKIRPQLCTALASAVSVLDDSCGISKNSAQHMVAALLCLDTSIQLDGEQANSGSRLSSVGCAILATILQYTQDASKAFVLSLLGLQPKQLKQIALDRGGCRVLEAVIEGEGPLHQKQRLMRSLRGAYGQMAVRPAGSFFVEKCYSWAEVDVKEDIVCELLGVESQLQVLNWGPSLAQLCALEVYKNGRQQWWARANRMVKTVSQFSQLFGDAKGKHYQQSQKATAGEMRLTDNTNAATTAGEKRGKKKRKKGEEEAAGAQQQNRKHTKKADAVTDADANGGEAEVRDGSPEEPDHVHAAGRGGTHRDDEGLGHKHDGQGLMDDQDGQELTNDLATVLHSSGKGGKAGRKRKSQKQREPSSQAELQEEGVIAIADEEGVEVPVLKAKKKKRKAGHEQKHDVKEAAGDADAELDRQQLTKGVGNTGGEQGSAGKVSVAAGADIAPVWKKKKKGDKCKK